MNPLIIHVAQTEITEESGVGRVAWHWKREFERRGYEFLHIGSEMVGALPHPGLFPYAAYRAYKRMKRPAALFLVHEPASGIFARRFEPTIVFSHGIERRGWQLALQWHDGAKTKVRQRTKILYPLWRLRQCDQGLRKATSLLLINFEDAAFAEKYYRRDAGEIHVFKNGVYQSKLSEKIQPKGKTILVLGSWLERKGIKTLIDVARMLRERGLPVCWLLAGTGAGSEEVLRCWPENIRPFIEVIPRFTRETEEALFARANLFVLPSFFEGQPLALLQAMEAGRCCITTNCCGQRDLIQHGFNGLLHEPGDALRLASLISGCFEDEELRLKLGANAKRSVEGRSWEVVSSEIADFVEGVLQLKNKESDGLVNSNCPAPAAGN